MVPIDNQNTDNLEIVGVAGTVHVDISCHSIYGKKWLKVGSLLLLSVI